MKTIKKLVQTVLLTEQHMHGWAGGILEAYAQKNSSWALRETGAGMELS